MVKAAILNRGSSLSPGLRPGKAAVMNGGSYPPAKAAVTNAESPLAWKTLILDCQPVWWQVQRLYLIRMAISVLIRLFLSILCRCQHVALKMMNFHSISKG